MAGKRGRRAWFAAGLSLLTLFVLFAATGAALADREPGALKGSFGVAEPQPGDRAVYSLALLVQMPALQAGLEQVPGFDAPDGDQAFFIDAGARMVVERLPDRVLPAEGGGLVATASYATTWSTEAFDWLGAGSWGYGAAAAGAQGEVQAEPWSVVHTVGGATVAVTLPPGRVGGDLPGRAVAADLGAEPAGVVTVFRPAAAPCGFHGGLQGREHELSRPVRVDGQCPPASSLLGQDIRPLDGVSVLANGHDDWNGQRATVFAHVDGPDRLRLWFAPDVPYPVRMLTKMADLEGQVIVHVLYEMTRFDPGLAAPAQAPEVGGALGPREAWGPGDDGAVHPFPLSAAWQAARDAGPLDEFLAAHPGAQADAARFVRWHDGGVLEERWTFTANDGAAAREFRVTQRTAPAGYGTLPEPLLGVLPLGTETTVLVEGRDASPAGRTPPVRMPASLPRVAPLFERWNAAASAQEAPQAWAFSLCEDCVGSWAAAGHAASTDGALRYSFLGLAPDGRPAFLEESHGPYAVPGEEPPGSYGPGYVPDAGSDGWNDPRGFGFGTAGFFGVWTFPEPETAATVGFAAAFVGLVTYVLWPLLKGLPGAGAIGLFSRIGPEQVLEHPLRSQIVALVEAEPGLHFQELARRLDTGRGTLEHHLRKLVAAQVVSAQASQGFTCYFPKGKVDRRLMAAAPVLKSGGARLVLQAISDAPGRAAQDVAAATGLTPSTVNYHLKRLAAVGLVETVRSGRFTLLTPTAIGQQALATWSGT